MVRKIVVATTNVSLIENLHEKLKDIEELEIIGCTGGFEALKRVRRERPKIALVEDILPQVDGYKFSRLIKFDKKFYHTIIFILSEDSSDDSKELAKEVGAEGILRYDQEQIQEAIKSYL